MTVQELKERGSSPHVRGAPYRQSIFCHCAGIIPACAGSTRLRPATTPRMRDHPRMCGEHPMLAHAPDAAGGSSPHVRGAPGDEHEPHR